MNVLYWSGIAAYVLIAAALAVAFLRENRHYPTVGDEAEEWLRQEAGQR